MLSIPYNGRVVLRFVTGTHPTTGNPIISARSWGNVKPEAADQAVYDIAVGLASLGVFSVADIRRFENKILEG
ncbi:MAG TPA: DUF1659 domain-containing protein [Atribacteraceae bacterium]|nr:DUF1659 domain-containing protein [Atribacteraceae bacterium]